MDEKDSKAPEPTGDLASLEEKQDEQIIATIKKSAEAQPKLDDVEYPVTPEEAFKQLQFAVYSHTGKQGRKHHGTFPTKGEAEDFHKDLVEKTKDQPDAPDYITIEELAVSSL